MSMIKDIMKLLIMVLLGGATSGFLVGFLYTIAPCKLLFGSRLTWGQYYLAVRWPLGVSGAGLMVCLTIWWLS